MAIYSEDEDPNVKMVQRQYNNAVKKIDKLIKKHEDGKCNCDLTEGGYGLCMAGQYLNKVISKEQFINEII
jgi:hypothetical protein